ncbi:MAG: 6-phosphogluconolactonase [Chlorobium limicola]|nr:6-phosphogluconolactonase [Chlorobium limicola]
MAEKNPFFITGNEAGITEYAAGLIISKAWQAAADRGRFTVALSGGRSPRSLYRKLATGVGPELMRRYDIPVPDCAVPMQDNLIVMPWSRTLIFWGDERCVSPDHPDSNYRMAAETLLDAPGIAPAHVFGMPCGQRYLPAEAAKLYENRIREAFNCRKTGTADNIPVFDLILLGLGDDGHTASLFPGDTDALNESNSLVIAVNVPEATPPERLTMTLPLINRAKTVIFFTSGEKRAELAGKIIRKSVSPNLPAGMVRPSNGKLFWFISVPSSLKICRRAP